MKVWKGRLAVSDARFLAVVVIIVLAFSAIDLSYVSIIQNDQSQVQSQLNSFRSQLNSSASTATAVQSSLSLLNSKLSSLPLVDQTPIIRNLRLEWSNTENSKQDRFFQSTIVVNQGDNVSVTFLSNDTDAHTFTLESPYNFQINATVPGTNDYLKNEAVFTTPATNNSPGVKVSGTPGNVSAKGSFIAKFAGIYEYFCIYHVQLGMFGYMIVLPNSAYSSSTGGQKSTTTASGKSVQVGMAGAGENPASLGFTPSTITVVIGVNNTVIWTNDDSAPHTVTANDGSFSSGNLEPGDSFSWTFTTPGTYAYHCSYHSWMMGTIIVKA